MFASLKIENKVYQYYYGIYLFKILWFISILFLIWNIWLTILDFERNALFFFLIFMNWWRFFKFFSFFTLFFLTKFEANEFFYNKKKNEVYYWYGFLREWDFKKLILPCFCSFFSWKIGKRNHTYLIFIPQIFCKHFFLILPTKLFVLSF